MPLIRDFRRFPFNPNRIDKCGRYVGSKLYWKLYAVENTVRIVINSVLTDQIGANWWNVAVDPDVVKRVARFRAHYSARPRNASPGADDIYLLFLTDLTEILRANSHLFLPIVVDTNSWITDLESMRVPRNLVGHMNFPNAFDKSAIDTTYSRLPSLVSQLTAQGVPIRIPK